MYENVKSGYREFHQSGTLRPIIFNCSSCLQTMIILNAYAAIFKSFFRPSKRPCLGVLRVPRLNFKRFHVAILEGSHVAIGISSEATDIDVDKFFCYDRTCI